MDTVDFQSLMLAGKKVRIWFPDGSSCLAENIEDLSITENCADRFEIVNNADNSEILRVAIIDADLIGRDHHRFPNLASEKLSAYWKEQGAQVELKLDYDDLDAYDHV